MANTPPRQSKRHRPRKERKTRSNHLSHAAPIAVPTAPQPMPVASLAAASAPTNPAPHVTGLLPYGAGLAAAALLCFSFATVIILKRASSPVEIEAASNAGPIAPDNPVATAGTSQSLANIRIINRPPEEPTSCDDAVWPYIDRKCLAGLNAETEAGKTAKSETAGETTRDATRDTTRDTTAKIGPKSIDSRSPNPLANAQSRDVPIGSVTAIAPARPKADATDGVATREAEPPVEAAAPRPLAPRPLASRRLASADRTPDVVKPRKSVRVAEQPEYRAKAERKKKRYQFVDTTPRTSYRRIPSERPEMPAFFFPFGLFTQAR
jgi:hypothetical protein